MSIELIKGNVLKFKKVRSSRYPTKTITDANYADDLILHIDPRQAVKIGNAPV